MLSISYHQTIMQETELQSADKRPIERSTEELIQSIKPQLLEQKMCKFAQLAPEPYCNEETVVVAIALIKNPEIASDIADKSDMSRQEVQALARKFLMISHNNSPGVKKAVLDDIFQTIRVVLQNIAGTEPEKVNWGSSCKDLIGYDSHDLLEFFMDLEDIHDINIKDEVLTDERKVGFTVRKTAAHIVGQLCKL